MNELALFAGAGGGILGTTLLGWKTICAVELDPYCRAVLLQRQMDGMLPMFPIWDNIKTFCSDRWLGKVDIITAGFPCQPFSVAGRKQGETDERNLWPDTIRVIRQVRPQYAFLENVPGLLTHKYFGRILGDLAESGYDAEWTCLGADDVGANHRRKRLWILAYSAEGISKEGQAQVGQQEQTRGRGMESSEMAYAHSQRLQGCRSIDESQLQKEERSRLVNRPSQSSWWISEPPLGRVAHGVANRVDRVKALGNGQVPAVVQTVFRTLKVRT